MPEKVGHTDNCIQFSQQLSKRQSHSISLICIQFETVTGIMLVFVSLSSHRELGWAILLMTSPDWLSVVC